MNKNMQAGNYSVKWDGRNDAGRLMASGIYFYRLTLNNNGIPAVSQQHKMILIR